MNKSLITGLTYPGGIAISGNDLFVANTLDGTIGEYSTFGATVSASLISGLDGPVLGVAISPVPEPSSGMLAGVAAAVFWLWSSRKSRA